MAYAVPVGLIGALCGLVVLSVGPENVADAIAYTASGPPNYIGQFEGASRQLPFKRIMLGCVVAGILSLWFARPLFILIAGALPVVLFASLARVEAHTDTLFFVIYLAALAPLFAWAAGDRTWARQVTAWILLP